MSVPTVEYGFMDIGSVIGSRVLAAGPVATVYAGHLAGGPAGEVAVKVFGDRFDRDTAARLERERRSLESQRCPAILGVDEIVETADGRSGVRMELCPRSLAGSLAGTPGALALPDALRIGSAIAAALAAGHRVGVVHGAVTPHNVLHRRTGETVVADFGLALRDRFPRDPVHALEYIAPETLRENQRTTASDWYGLGALLFAMLTGAPPFPGGAGQAAGERILQVLREPAPRLEDVPVALSGLVARLLAKDPEDRPADAAEVISVLDALQTRPAVPDGDFDFDDFAGSGPVAGFQPPVAPVSPAAPVGRTLIHTTEPPVPQRRLKPRHGVLAGLGVLAVGLVTVAPMVFGQQPSQSTTSPPAAAPGQSPQASPVAPVRIVLAPPADQGRQVQLAWSAEGDLDFAVVVAGEQIDTMVLVARRGRTLTVPVDPDRKYCFQVRGTDGRQIWTSEPVAIRGAQCKL